MRATQQLEYTETIEGVCCDGLEEESQAQFSAFE